MPSNQITPRVFFIDALTADRPRAMAWVVDNRNNPTTSGLVRFYQPSNGGVLVEAEFFGLPEYRGGINSGFFAFHIHDAENCSQLMSPTGSQIMPRSDSTLMNSLNGNRNAMYNGSSLTSMNGNRNGGASLTSMGAINGGGQSNSMNGNGSTPSIPAGTMIPISSTPAMPMGPSTINGNTMNGMANDSMGSMPGHYNPAGTLHPFHAGDFPPLLSNQGYAWMTFFDKRFTIDEIIGKTVALHSGMDDFTSQPSGNSGNPIACGEIRREY